MNTKLKANPEKISVAFHYFNNQSNTAPDKLTEFAASTVTATIRISSTAQGRRTIEISSLKNEGIKFISKIRK